MQYLILLVTSVAFAVPNISVDGWAREFKMDSEKFSGVWSKEKNWKGVACSGQAKFAATTGGLVRDIKFKLEDGYIEAEAKLSEVWGRLQGNYRSELSVCYPLKPWLGVVSDWAYLKARIYLNEDAEATALKKIEIIESSFGRLHFGEWVPTYFEDFATEWTNDGLAYVWKSKLGKWVNKKLSERLKQSGFMKDALKVK